MTLELQTDSVTLQRLLDTMTSNDDPKLPSGSCHGLSPGIP